MGATVPENTLLRKSPSPNPSKLQSVSRSSSRTPSGPKRTGHETSRASSRGAGYILGNVHTNVETLTPDSAFVADAESPLEFLRFEPKQLVFETTGSNQTQRKLVRVSNYGSRTKVFSLTLPKSSTFRLLGESAKDGESQPLPQILKVIPGFGFSFYVEASFQRHRSIINDEICLLEKNNAASSIVLPIAAVPVLPNIAATDAVDFGILVLDKNILPAPELEEYFSTSEFSHGASQIAETGKLCTENRDTSPVVVTISSSSPNITIPVSQKVINPGAKFDFEFTFIAKECDMYKLQVELACFYADDAEKDSANDRLRIKESRADCALLKKATVTAAVYSSKVRLLDAATGEALGTHPSLAFDNLFYGQSDEIDLYLENVTDMPLLAVFKYAGAQDPSVLQISKDGKSSGQLSSFLNSQKINIMLSCVSIDPISSTILPYERIPLKIKFLPHSFRFENLEIPISSLRVGLQACGYPPYYNDSLNLRTWAEQSEQKVFYLPLRLHTTTEIEKSGNLSDFFVRSVYNNILFKGEVFPLIATSSVTELCFDQLAKGQSQTKYFSVSNKSSALPIAIQIPKLAHFRLEEYAYRLEPLTTLKIPVTFLPNQLGQLDQTLVILILSTVLSARQTLKKEKLGLYCNQKLGLLEIQLRASCHASYPLDVAVVQSKTESSANLLPDVYAKKAVDLGRFAEDTPSHLISHVRTLAIADLKTASKSPQVGNIIMPSEQDEHEHGSSARPVLVVTKDKIADVFQSTNPDKEAFYSRRKAYDDYVRSRRLVKEAQLLMNSGGEIEAVDSDNYEVARLDQQISETELQSTRVARELVQAPIGSDGFFQIDILKGLSSSKIAEVEQELLNPRADPAITLRTGGAQIFDLEPENLVTHPLSLVNLAKIIVPNRVINLGEVAVRASMAFPLNFFNGNLDGPPISISMALLNQAATGISVWPWTVQVQPGEVNGFAAVFRWDSEGPVSRRLNYVVNGLHRFVVTVEAQVVSLNLVVQPPILSIDMKDIDSDPEGYLDVATNSFITRLSSDKSRKMRIMLPKTLKNINNLDANSGSYDVQFMYAEIQMTLKNAGGTEVGYYWSIANKASRSKGAGTSQSVTAKRQAQVKGVNFNDEDASKLSSIGTMPYNKSSKLQIPEHHWFLVSPAFGKIGPFSETTIAVRCVFGMHNFDEELFQVDVVDLHTNSNHIVHTIPVPFNCTMQQVEPSLTHLSKHSVLDFGVIPLAFQGDTNMLNSATATTIIRSKPPEADVVAAKKKAAAAAAAVALKQGRTGSEKQSLRLSTSSRPDRTSNASKTDRTSNSLRPDTSLNASKLDFNSPKNSVLSGALLSQSDSLSSNIPVALSEKTQRKKLTGGIKASEQESTTIATTTSANTKTLKLKNTSKGRSYFIVSLDSDIDVIVSPKYGILFDNCTGLDINITPCPSKEGVFENAVTVQVYGNLTPLKVPFKYQARKPEIEFAVQKRGLSKADSINENGSSKLGTNESVLSGSQLPGAGDDALETCMVSTDLFTCFKLKNLNQYSIRCFFSLLDISDLNLFLREIDYTEGSSGPAKLGSESAKRLNNLDFSKDSEKGGLCVTSRDVGNCTDLSLFTKPYEFNLPSNDHERASSSKLLTVNVVKKMRMAVFDILPRSTVLGQIRFSPTRPQKCVYALPFYVTGVLLPFYIHIKMEAVVSPLELSKTELRFKNRVVSTGENINIGSQVTKQYSVGSVLSDSFVENSAVSVASNRHARAESTTSSISIDDSLEGNQVAEAGAGRTGSALSFSEHSQNVQSLTITNISNKMVTFIVGKPIDQNSKGRRSSYSVYPARETLAPGAQTTLQVLFRPTGRGKFVSRIPIYVNEVTEKAPLHIDVCGNGVRKSINFDPPRVLMTLSTLDTPIIMPIYLVNFGCDRTDISVNIPPEIAQTVGDLSVVFPEGKYLKQNGEKVLVLIKFVPRSLSDLRGRAVSFSTKIEFRDNRNFSYYLPVHAMSENSSVILSIARSLMTESSVRMRLREILPSVLYYEVMKMSDIEIKKLYLQDKTIAQKRVSLFGCELRSSCCEKANVAISLAIASLHNRLIYPVTGKSYKDSSVPSCYVNSKGMPILQALAAICDFNISSTKFGEFFVKKVQANGAAASSSPKSSSNTAKDADICTTEAYDWAASFLNQLKASGLNLSLVQPEFLLSFEDYIQYVECLKNNTPVTDEEVAYYELVGEFHWFFAKESWFLVLAQSYNIAVASNFPQQKYLQYHTTESNVLEEASKMRIEDSYLSNVTNPGEYALRHFYSTIYKLQTGRTWRIPDFGRSFSDCYIFSVAIKFYLPELHRDYLRGMYSSDEGRVQLTDEQMSSNVLALQRAVATLLLLDDVETFLTLDACRARCGTTMNTVGALLYQIMPQFRSVGMIHISCKMYNTVAKMIEINNPLPQDVEFNGIIEPNLSITMPKNRITVPAKGTAVVRLEATAKTTRPVSAVLVIVPKKIFLNVCNMFVYFATVSMAQILPLKTFLMQAPVFSTTPVSMPITVRNPLPEKGNFCISIQFNKTISELTPVVNEAERLPPLHIHKRRVEIGPHRTVTIGLELLPLRLTIEQYFVHFSDPAVGDFVYAVKCIGTLPVVEECYDFECPSLITLKQNIALQFKKEQREQAAKAYLRFVENVELPEWSLDDRGQLHYVPTMSEAALPQKLLTAKEEEAMPRLSNVSGTSEKDQKLHAIQKETNRNNIHVNLSLQRVLRWPSDSFMRYKVYVLPVDESSLRQRESAVFQRRLLEQLFQSASHYGQLVTGSGIFKAIPEVSIGRDLDPSANANLSINKISFEFYAMKPGKSACFFLLRGENVHDYRLFLVTVSAKLTSLITDV